MTGDNDSRWKVEALLTDIDDPPGLDEEDREEKHPDKDKWMACRVKGANERFYASEDWKLPGLSFSGAFQHVYFIQSPTLE